MDIWCDGGVNPNDIYFLSLPPGRFIPLYAPKAAAVIKDLSVPTLEAQQCDRCGALLKVGDWPWCPHAPARAAHALGWVV